MAIDRRRFLKAGGALLGLPGVAWARPAGAVAHHYVTSRRRDGQYEAVLLDAMGRDTHAVALPERGHSFAIDAARGRAVIFGRQPGFYALAFDLRGRQAPRSLPLPEGRHFFGHGVFSPDGSRLFSTENDYEGGRSVVGVYDASPGGQWRRLGEFDGGGIGAHEVILMPDGRTLCLANGGILTHPDYGKLELNLADMRPSLAYLDTAHGEIVEQVELEPALHQLSLRHLALAGDGAAWFGCQYVGPAAERPALVGRHRRGRAPELFEGDPQGLRGMQNYVGTVAADASGTIMATSSPVGGRVLYWDAATGRQLGETLLPDGCGAAQDGIGGFLLSSGHGDLLRTGPGRERKPVLAPSRNLAWDNHLRHLSLDEA
ncbi:putative exported protein [plant metagenome]|uniref:Putative exported protein n=1 Tax=plant metagenome TaxID=1297885 RepID=A0A484SP10_9ZZZZ